MSHFAVLVPAKDRDTLERILLPYHEYECTGIEEYTVLLDETDEIKKDYEEYGDGKPFDEFVEGWTNAKPGADGRYYRRTNPNAKWDWWLVGGRWTGILRLKSLEAVERAGNGEPGLMTDKNKDPLLVDFADVGDINWSSMRDDGFAEAKARWQTYQDAAGKADTIIAVGNVPPAITERATKRHSETSGRWTTEYLTRLFLIDKILSNDHDMHVFHDRDDMELSEDAFDAKFKPRAIAYAFVDLEGGWNQRGEMGWWGMDDPERGTPDYDEIFWQFIESLPSNQRIYVVDCHI